MKTLCFAVLLALTAAAQPRISATITPNPCPVGVNPTIRLEATVNAQSLSSCGTNAIIAGSPGGPLAWACTFPLTMAPVIGPGTPQSAVVPLAGVTLTPGHYWMRVPWRTISPLVVQPVAYFAFRVDPANSYGGPVLSATGLPTRGQYLSLALNDTNQPGAFYQLALSLTTNVGIPAGPSVHVALDPDPFLSLTYPNADPILFPDFLGFLDPSGGSSFFNPAAYIPNYTNLRGLPLAIQGAVTAPSGVVTLTNCLTLSIQ